MQQKPPAQRLLLEAACCAAVQISSPLKEESFLMLKRAFALLMTLCLALAAVGPAAAEAQNASFYLQSYSASAPA